MSGALSVSVPLGVTESFAYDGVPAGTYTFTVHAVNAAGVPGASSNPVTLTFPATCSGPPQSPTQFMAYRVGRTIFVLWDPPAAGAAPTGYVVNVTGSFTGSVPTGGRQLSGAVGPGTYSPDSRRDEPVRHQRRVHLARDHGAVTGTAGSTNRSRDHEINHQITKSTD